MEIPLRNIEKFKIVETASLMKLGLGGKRHECFICYGDKHNIINQEIEHRYTNNNEEEGIQLHWKNNPFSVGWEENYIIIHE